eukprot:CAMPEP_0194326688 /NCGR_PEP_ID=MMETSP0171-20130528/37931_1 /TAXON_ID=218684 /ORGANISM="Corethron pennatum, Strain L29A3" /LENGTH=58 /DNA_ID=CAMNT_0039086377 /DNA_START=1 /DNA_END=173 /DNA_ORIENTATION=+
MLRHTGMTVPVRGGSARKKTSSPTPDETASAAHDASFDLKAALDPSPLTPSGKRRPTP